MGAPDRRLEAFGSQVAAWLGPVVGTATTTSVERLSGGASRQSFAVTLTTASGERKVVVQRKRSGGLGARLVDEAALVEIAGRSGVRVPTVLAATDDSSVVGGEALAVDFVTGESLAPVILRDDAWQTARQILPGQAAAALAHIGQITTTDERLRWLRTDDPLTLIDALHHGLGRAQPVIELGLRWLAAHRPPAVANRVVHGDFRLGNLMVDPHDGLVAVLDWELAHLGDPVEDLAWACVKAWRFGSDAPALGLCGIEHWVDLWVASGGSRPDHHRLLWWLVYGTLRWAVICELQVAAHLSGLAPSVELAVLGRRVAESEHDLLVLLGALDLSGVPDGEVAPVGDAGGSPVEPPHDAPGVDDLLGVVESYLRNDVPGATTGQVRFHGRVAANAVGIVRRQLADAGQAGHRHQARLEALGFSGDGGLADALRSGRLDDRLDEIGAVLGPSVVDKLRVANPGYLLTPSADPWSTAE